MLLPLAYSDSSRLGPSHTFHQVDGKGNIPLGGLAYFCRPAEMARPSMPQPSKLDTADALFARVGEAAVILDETSFARALIVGPDEQVYLGPNSLEGIVSMGPSHALVSPI